MKCPRCQHENPSGVKFCGECGAKLESSCPYCRASNPPTNKFCNECGAPLAQLATTAKFLSPESYTPQHLAEKILTSKSALEGERKQITVLFADLKGSMELLADRDAEQARKLLDPVLEHMMEAVHRYEGTVNQVMGDGIMALFGAPLAHEDHAVRACYAALRMQESVKRYSEGVRRTEGIPIQIRVGLNSGEVVVRSIGSDLKMDYTAVGQTTHLAARMEQMATPGSILVAPETLRLAEGFVQVKPLGPINVKGLSEPVEVYEITGAGPVRSRLQAAAARGLTRFVGRTAEFETLCQALKRARAGRGQVVALVGEPGVGKSRLFWEFTHSPRTVGWLILESGSVSYGKATAYLPVIDLLKAYFTIEDRDDVRKIREKVTGKLLTLDKSLEPALPAFLTLFDVAVEDQQWQSLDPPQRRQRTLDAITRLLLRESQVQPLLLVIEDLHWIDSETQAFLDSLTETLPTARLLLLVNYRPEYQHSWGGKTYYGQLRIDPLLPESAGELLDGLLGADAHMQPLKQLLIERTEGNPFFLEESVRTLVETKVLVGEQGNYSLTKPIEGTQIPATVQAVLAARIDRLLPEEKRLLQSAAVIGKDIPFVLLQAIADQSDDELRKALTSLQAAEFLYQTALFPDLEYTFKHALTHEVAYGTLLQDRRRTLHTRIVETTERLYGDRLVEQVERLADHAVRGEVWDKAVRYLREAGTKAFSRSANIEAVGYFTRALEVVEMLSLSGERKKQELALLVALGPALQSTKGFGAPEIEPLYLRARELCQQIGETSQLFPVLWGLWLLYLQRAELQTARDLATQLFSLAQHLRDIALLLEAHHALWATSFWLGELTLVRGHSEHGIELYDSQQHRVLAFLYGGHDPGVCCRDFGALALWLLGYPDQALKKSRDAIALAEELSHPLSLAEALGYAAWLYEFRREPEAVQERAEALLALASKHGFPYWLTQATILRGWALADKGQTAEEGVAQMCQGLLAYRTTGAEVARAHYLLLLAKIYGKVKKAEEGLTVMSEVLTWSRKNTGWYYEAELHRLKGELLLNAECEMENAEFVRRSAEESFSEAIEISRRQQAKSLELRAAMSMSRLWDKQGKKAEARQLLAEIYGWFTEGFSTADLREAKALLEELS
ncbi:MAG TPA: adenylate/guanylate cyclase domain-containing protein [Candidatus Binatia bacterium]